MQVFYSQMCDLIKLGLNGRVFQCPSSRVAFFIPIIYMRVYRASAVRSLAVFNCQLFRQRIRYLQLPPLRFSVQSACNS